MSDAINQYQFKCISKRHKNECVLNKNKIKFKKATSNDSKISLNNAWEETSEENGLSEKQSALFSENTSAESIEKLIRFRNRSKKFLKIRRRRKHFKSNVCTWRIPSGFRKSCQKIKTRKKSRRKNHNSKEEKCLGFGKKFWIGKKFSLEKRAEFPTKGKRGRLGGKAKGKPPQKVRRRM